MIVILTVVGGVLILHLILEFITKRYKAWKRQRSQLDSQANSVRFLRAKKVQEEGSEDDSDVGETSRLIVLMEEPSTQPNGSSYADKCGSSTRMSAVSDDGTNSLLAAEEGRSSGVVRSALETEDRVHDDESDSQETSRLISVTDKTQTSPLIASFSDELDISDHSQPVGQDEGTGFGCEQETGSEITAELVRLAVEVREGSVLSDCSGTWSPIYRDTGAEDLSGAGLVGSGDSRRERESYCGGEGGHGEGEGGHGEGEGGHGEEGGGHGEGGRGGLGEGGSSSEGQADAVIRSSDGRDGKGANNDADVVIREADLIDIDLRADTVVTETQAQESGRDWRT